MRNFSGYFVHNFTMANFIANVPDLSIKNIRCFDII
jgi:hypothetical protein